MKSATTTIKTAPDRDAWIVTAEWYGAERVVYTGTLYECLRFASEQEA